MLMLPSEQVELSFIRAIEQQNIESWQHFEYLLSFILENRLLQIYQAHHSSRPAILPGPLDDIAVDTESLQHALLEDERLQELSMKK